MHILLNANDPCQDVCQTHSVVIQHKAIAKLQEHSYQHIALYSPIHQEVNTRGIVEHIWQQGKHAYLPKLVHDTLVFTLFTPQNHL